MTKQLKILGINGSASPQASNLSILNTIVEMGQGAFEMEIIDSLADLPHFNTECTVNDVPEKIIEFRNQIECADGVIICTPEYVFSIPSRLKNAIEWCVATVVFTDKPVGLITAAASGEKGHEELKLIMKTLQSNFTADTTLLLQGIKGKINSSGKIFDEHTKSALVQFVQSFHKLTKTIAENKVHPL